MIDTLRKQIQERLDQLLSETDRLRRALAALDRRGGSSAPPRSTVSGPQSATHRKRTSQSTRARRRTPPGATKARVLRALSDRKAMTAGQVAAATGLARPTVSTTLSKLAKRGQVVKGERGYRLPSP